MLEARPWSQPVAGLSVVAVICVVLEWNQGARAAATAIVIKLLTWYLYIESKLVGAGEIL